MRGRSGWNRPTEGRTIANPVDTPRCKGTHVANRPTVGSSRPTPTRCPGSKTWPPPSTVADRLSVPSAVDPSTREWGLPKPVQMEHPTAERPGQAGAGLLGFVWLDGGRDARSPRSLGLGAEPRCLSRPVLGSVARMSWCGRPARAAGRRSKAWRRAGTVAPRQRRLDATLTDRIGGPLYFPFELSDKRPLRTAQRYLVKFPKDLLSAVPDLQALFDLAVAAPASEAGPSTALSRRARIGRRGAQPPSGSKLRLPS